jgi:hypothetical protein
MRNQGEGNAFREQGERGGEAGEGVGAKASWFHGLPDWAPVKSRLPEKWCEKQGEWYGIKDLGASDWLSGACFAGQREQAASPRRACLAMKIRLWIFIGTLSRCPCATFFVCGRKLLSAGL